MLIPRNRNYDIFDEIFKDPFFTNTFDRSDASLMKTDILDQETHYLLEIELPGYKKEDVQAQLKDGYLTVTAKRNENTSEARTHFLRKERFSGTCKRTFYVGDEVRQEDIKAGFQDGILRLAIPKELPKKVDETPQYITIE